MRESARLELEVTLKDDVVEVAERVEIAPANRFPSTDVTGFIRTGSPLGAIGRWNPRANKISTIRDDRKSPNAA